MDDSEMRRVLEEYSDTQLDAYCKKYDNQPEHIFSPVFEKKMQRLIKNQKRYGRHAVLGGKIARAASILLICGIILAGASHISAKYFGMNPWKEFIVNQGDMDKVQFRKKEGAEEKGVIRKHMIPTYVPEGFELTYKDINTNLFKVYDTTWKTEDEKGMILFSSIEINEDNVELRDNEFVKVNNASVAKYKAKLCYKADNNIFLIWNDDVFENMVTFTGVEVNPQKMKSQEKRSIKLH